jgi:hypothetical protein
MPTPREVRPGTPAPEAGRYELCHVTGVCTGLTVDVVIGDKLPAASGNWYWSYVTTEEPAVSLQSDDP